MMTTDSGVDRVLLQNQHETMAVNDDDVDDDEKSNPKPLNRWSVFFQCLAPPFFSKVCLDPPPSRVLVTVIILGFLDTKSVNCHRDSGGHGRHPRNCRRFSTLG